MAKLPIGISSCLLGNKVRYDGKGKLDLYLRNLLPDLIQWHELCPESESGMPIPREKIYYQLPEKRLVGRESGLDCSVMMTEYFRKKAHTFREDNICALVLKSKSPSCGIAPTLGMFADLAQKSFPGMPMTDEIAIHDPFHLEGFLHQAAFFRLQENLSRGTLQMNPEEWKKYLLQIRWIPGLHGAEEFFARISDRNLPECFPAPTQACLAALLEIARQPVTLEQYQKVLYAVFETVKPAMDAEDCQLLTKQLERMPEVEDLRFPIMAVLSHVGCKKNLPGFSPNGNFSLGTWLLRC